MTHRLAASRGHLGVGPVSNPTLPEPSPEGGMTRTAKCTSAEDLIATHLNSCLPPGTPPAIAFALDLPLRHGAAEPVPETCRAENRVFAGSQALIVQFGAEVASVDVRDHLPGVFR